MKRSLAAVSERCSNAGGCGGGGGGGDVCIKSPPPCVGGTRQNAEIEDIGEDVAGGIKYPPLEDATAAAAAKSLGSTKNGSCAVGGGGGGGSTVGAGKVFLLPFVKSMASGKGATRGGCGGGGGGGAENWLGGVICEVVVEGEGLRVEDEGGLIDAVFVVAGTNVVCCCCCCCCCSLK